MANKSEIKKLCERQYAESRKEAKLYKCVPVDWLWMPKLIRHAVGMVTMIMFACTFLSAIFIPLFFIPAVWRFSPTACTVVVASFVISMMLPSREWKFGRKIGQLWYELLDFHSNVDPKYCVNVTNSCTTPGDETKLIMAMHPHGIVPFHALLWAAYCDQHYVYEDKKLYGFGAAADVVAYLPFLRNIMGWMAAGSAEYKALKDGIDNGYCPPVAANGEQCRGNLYILPGGIAEVFTSAPKKHAIVFKNRKGLIKLSLETGAQLCPTYVFGATDFFENLATNENSLFAKFSRKFRMGITIFWGYFGLPIPYLPKVTLCIAEPIPSEKWDVETKGPVPREMVEKLHEKYIASIVDLFETYKVAAGYPNAQLEIQ